MCVCVCVCVCEICSKLTKKTPERRHSVSIIDFEQVNAGWGTLLLLI